MIRIILDENQAESLKNTEGAIQLCDQAGRLLGFASPKPNVEAVHQAKDRSSSEGPWLSTEEVRSQLDSLEQG